MFLSYLIFSIALSLSAIAAFYSIVGLTSIFASASIAVMVMGSILEVAKVSITVWLHQYWKQCRVSMKLYLLPAMLILMVITSMGIFGFLSAAHLNQSLVNNDVQAKIAVYDQKILTAKENIETSRKELAQLNAAVDQVMARSKDEQGAIRSSSIRKSQQKERARILAEIDFEQKKIGQLNDESAPIRAQVRKVEAEVGPIKYIAAMIYGDNPDQNLLERAVRWVIILIVIVFDPLAIMMILAATESIGWEREKRKNKAVKSVTADQVEPEVNLVTDLQANESEIKPIVESVTEHKSVTADQVEPEPVLEPVVEPKVETVVSNEIEPESMVESEVEVVVPNEPEVVPMVEPVANEPEVEPVANEPEVEPVTESVVINEPEVEPVANEPEVEPVTESVVINEPEVVPMVEPVANSVLDDKLDTVDDSFVNEDLKTIGLVEKTNDEQQHSEDVFEEQKVEVNEKHINHLSQGNSTVKEQSQHTLDDVGFGIKFPENPTKNLMFVRVDFMPSRLFKYNGFKWIEIDKNNTDTYAHNDRYIDHLIAKLSTGEYDLENLSLIEQQQIEQRLKSIAND